MGLLSRLRSHENSSKAKPSSRVNGHQRGLTSESSSASEFLAASYSSYSSQDSPRATDHAPGDLLQKKPPVGTIELPKRAVANLRLEPATQIKSSNPIPTQNDLPTRTTGQQRGQNNVETFAQYQQRQHQQHQQHQYHYQQQQPYGQSTARTYSSDAVPSARGYQGYSPSLQPPSNVHRVVSEVSLSETDYSSSDINSGTEYEDDLEYNAAQSHPYYNQWKQYYQAMALYQALMAQKQGASARNSMYLGAVPSSRTPSAAGSRPPSRPMSVANYLNSHLDSIGIENNLLKNSRRCTLKSNRSASVPLLQPLAQEEKPIGTRAISVDVSSAIKRTSSNNGGEEEEFASDNVDEPTQSVLVAPTTQLVIHNLHEMMIEPQETRQISDYGAFLQSDNEETRTPTPELRLYEPEMTPKLSTLEAMQQSPSHETPKLSAIKTSPKPVLSLNSLEDEILKGVEVYSLPPESPKKSVAISFDPPKLVDDLNRQNSTASTSSYNSLQSEKNFFVSKTPNRVATIVSRNLSRASRNANPSSGPTFVPPMPGPPPPIFTNAPREVPEVAMGYNQGHDLHRHSMINLNGANDLMFMPQMQQQFHPQMLPMRPFLVYQPQGVLSAQTAGPFSTDPVINKRIEEFIQLRRIIASGNKTLEYRLKWMKMLLTATNYKLYSYINVKGSGVAADQVMANKHLFIKAFVSHLQKLLKELDANRDLRKDKTFAEVCYIQGCLYMNDYVEKYGQDFGFLRDDDEAERFLQHCVQLNPLYFRAYYKLGELYESQETEEKFDMAMEQYKESAQMGYNKAIYKVALIFLYVPKVRLIKFYKYLKDLASIDMELAEIQLEGPDRDELEEVVGLALFQLGKIHEGIYPGDLTLECEFVQEATSIAKVDYARSLSYYNRAAKLHCLEAQVRLGRIYEFGELNRKPNASKSIQWYIKATTSPLKFKRHPEAMLGVSRWFLKGSNGTSKHIPYPNPEGAIMWCERACKEFKYPEAYYQMGLLVEGDFVDGDAYEWFAEASQLGHVEAQAKIRGC